MNADAKWWHSRTAATAPGRLSVKKCKVIGDLYEKDPTGKRAGAYINDISGHISKSAYSPRKKPVYKRYAVLPVEAINCQKEIIAYKEKLPYTLKNPPAWLIDFFATKRIYFHKLIVLSVAYRRFGFRTFYAGATSIHKNRKVCNDAQQRGWLLEYDYRSNFKRVRFNEKYKDDLDRLLKFFEEVSS